MNEDDPELIKCSVSFAVPGIPCPEKTCTKPVKDDSTNNIQTADDVSVDLDELTDINTSNRTDSGVDSSFSSKRLSKGKHKRRSGAKKHRAGRNRKRKWKPYYKLTSEERNKLDERNARRALRIRDEMSAEGRTLAPFNTNVFLIDDYLSCHPKTKTDCEEACNEHRYEKNNHSNDSSDEHYQSCSDDNNSFDFHQEYEKASRVYNQNVSKYSLAEQIMGLEDKVEVLEKQLKDLREQKRLQGMDILDPDAEMEKIKVFREEIGKLYEENNDLEIKNEELQKLNHYNS